MGTNQFISIGGKKVFNGIDGVYKRKSNDDLVFLKHSSTEEWMDLEGNEFSFKRYDLTIEEALNDHPLRELGANEEDIIKIEYSGFPIATVMIKRFDIPQHYDA